LGGGLLFASAMAFFWMLLSGKKGSAAYSPVPSGEARIDLPHLQVLPGNTPLPPGGLSEDLSARERAAMTALHIDLDTMDVSEDATASELEAGIPYAVEAANAMRAVGATGPATNLEGLIALARARLADLGGEAVSGSSIAGSGTRRRTMLPPAHD